MFDKNSKIYIAGHTGLLGNAIKRVLEGFNYTNLIYKTHTELELCDKNSVFDFFKQERPEYVFLYAIMGIARASIYAIQVNNNLSNTHYNIGSGIDISIKELAEKISNIIGYEGKIELDFTKPDGILKKLLDSSKFNSLGWYPSIDFDSGLKFTINLYKDNYDRL